MVTIEQLPQQHGLFQVFNCKIPCIKEIATTTAALGLNELVEGLLYLSYTLLLLQLRKCPFRFQAETPTILTEAYRGFPQFFQTTDMIVIQVRLRLISFVFPYSLFSIIQFFDATQSETLTARFSKQQINKIKKFCNVSTCVRGTILFRNDSVYSSTEYPCSSTPEHPAVQNNLL